MISEPQFATDARLNPNPTPFRDRDGADLTDEIKCCAKHLAVAATDLARDARTAPRLASRLPAAEAQFRALASSFEGLLPVGLRTPIPSPVVPIDDETTVPLVVLLADIYVRERWWLTNGSVVPELVAGARELLCGLRWVLPGEDPFADA